MPRIKSRLSLISLLLLSKAKPHGRFKPRRQLRLFAVLGFVFVGCLIRARRLRFSPSPPRRRGLHIVRDDFFMLLGKSHLSLIPSLLLSKIKPARPLHASSTTSALRCAGLYFVFSCKSRDTGHFHRIVADCISFATTFFASR